jgi:hypothetical protein
LTNITNNEGIIVPTKQTGKKNEELSQTDSTSSNEIVFYDQFHPAIIAECFDDNVMKFESFDVTVDEFFSKVESQKLDMKQLTQVFQRII